MEIIVDKFDLQGYEVGEKLQELEKELGLKLFHEYEQCSTLQDCIDIFINNMSGVAKNFREHNLYGSEDNYFEYSFNNSEFTCREGMVEYTFHLADRSVTIRKYKYQD